MGSRYFCVTMIVFSGSLSYMFIAILFPYGIHRSRGYDRLMMSFIDCRPRNSYMRQPKRLLEQLCDNDPCLAGKNVNWTLVIFIKSKTDYFKRREFLRRTWTSINYMNGVKFETVFLMGRSEDPFVDALLDEEEERYNDILQFNGPDDYDNMPYKVLAGMEWASKHLDENTLYASADDDFLINVETLAKSVTNVVDHSRWKATHKFTKALDYRHLVPIMCMFVKGETEKPMRVQGYKWYVSYNEYRQEVYPPYCHGGMYVMSLPVATKLWNVSRTAPMLRLDDVWITGILRRRMNFSDSLVLKMPDLTKHFGTVNDAVRDSMNNQWKILSYSFKNDTMCTCTL